MVDNVIRSILVVVFILVPGYLAAGEEAMNEEELKAFLSGKTVRGIYLDMDKPFVRYYEEDGTVRQSAGEELQEGEWYIDPQGRRCIVWSNKEKSCRIIVKDEALYKEFLIQKDGKRKLMVIYNKVIDGNPEDL